MYTQLGLYIDGKWNHGNGGGGEDVINPATEKPLAHLPHAPHSDLDAALAAAQKGFQSGRQNPPMTAAASSRRPPTWCANAPTRSRAS